MNLTRLIGIINRDIYAYLGKKFKKIDITSGQFMFILCIGENEGLSQDKLAKELCMNKSTIARVITDLELKEMVYRNQNNIDGRVYNIYLTKKGLDLYPLIKKIIDDFNSYILESVSKENLKNLFNSLETIRNATEEEKN